MMDNTVIPALDEPQGKIRRRVRSHSVRVCVSIAQFNRLARAAERRDLQPNELARRIVATVLDHNLIMAVLDDGNN